MKISQKTWKTNKVKCTLQQLDLGDFTRSQYVSKNSWLALSLSVYEYFSGEFKSQMEYYKEEYVSWRAANTFWFCCGAKRKILKLLIFCERVQKLKIYLHTHIFIYSFPAIIWSKNVSFCCFYYNNNCMLRNWRKIMKNKK